MGDILKIFDFLHKFLHVCQIFIMFSNTFQSGFLSIFYSIGSSPLNIWDKAVKNGHIRRLVDDEVKSLVLELSGTNVATTYITCPIKPRSSLGIRLPYLVMVVKNMKKYFSFEIQILDDKDTRRRFRVSNFQSTTKVRPFCTTMPIGLSTGWNQIQFNLADFTKRAYGTIYMETMRVQIHANVRIRRIYFSDRLYSEEEMPSEYKLFLPVTGTKTTTAKKPGRLSNTQVEAKAPKPDLEIPAAAPPTPSIIIEVPPTVVETAAMPSPEAPSEEPPSTEATAGDGLDTERTDVTESTVAEGGEGEAPPAVEGEAAVVIEGGEPAEGEAPVAPVAEATEAAPEGEAPAPAPAETPVEEAPPAPPAEEEAAPPPAE